MSSQEKSYSRTNSVVHFEKSSFAMRRKSYTYERKENKNVEDKKNRSYSNPQLRTRNDDSAFTKDMDDQNENLKNESKKCGLTLSEKYLYTAVLCYCYMSFGIISTGISASLVDLKYIFDVDMNSVSIYFTINGIGYVCGSLFGVLFKYINRQITIFIVSSLMGISFTLIPHSPSLPIFYLVAFIVGLCGGAIDCASTVWLMEMWQEKCNTFLQAIQFAFGVGTILAPMISRQFLHGENEPNGNFTTTTSSTLVLSQQITYQQEDSLYDNKEQNERKSCLTLPFIIMGSIQLMAGVFQCMLLFYNKYEYNEEQEKQNTNQEMKIKVEVKKTDSDSSRQSVLTISESVSGSVADSRTKLFNKPGAPLMLILILGSVCLAAYTAAESGHFQFSPTFSQNIPIKLTASDAADMHSIFATCYTIGRGLAIFIALKLLPQHILIGNFTILIAAHITFIFGTNSRPLILIANILMGFGCSSTWACFFAFIEQYLEFSDALSTVFIFLVGLVQGVEPLILGKLIEKLPLTMVYYNLSLVSLSIILFGFILLLIKVYHQKCESSVNEINSRGQRGSQGPRCSITSLNAAHSYLKTKKRLPAWQSNHFYDCNKSFENP